MLACGFSQPMPGLTICPPLKGRRCRTVSCIRAGYCSTSTYTIGWALDVARRHTRSGYAYVISNIGLVGLAVFWFWFLSLDGRSRYFYAFRNTSAAYFAALFCISPSQFTIKTAALLWFLMGTLSGSKDRDVLVKQHGSSPSHAGSTGANVMREANRSETGLRHVTWCPR